MNPRSTAAASGKTGEEFAAELLKRQGYQVLARNAHSRYGEVDIVARRGATVCFVEVKTRRRGALVSGAAAVGAAKQRKIIQTALHWLGEHPEWDLQPRFDVISVETDSGGTVLNYDYIEGAFDGEAYGD